MASHITLCRALQQHACKGLVARLVPLPILTLHAFFVPLMSRTSLLRYTG